VRRHLFLFCSVVSLLLFMAVCVLWVRSYRVGEAVYREGPAFRLAVMSEKGQCSAFRTTYPKSADNGPPRWMHSDRGMWAEVTRRPGLYRADPAAQCYGPIAGFGWVDRPAGPLGMGTREVFFPYWSLAMLTAAGPAAWWRQARRRARARSLGLCPSCGYDLRVQRALTEAGDPTANAMPPRCPECGAAGTMPASP
jgi:hypothetical protein